MSAETDVFMQKYMATQDIEWLKKAAEQGEAIAQYMLAFFYFDGNHVPKDFDKGFKLILKAAEQGNVDAQLTLGGMYARGTDVPRDFEKAAEWCRKAAAQGDEKAKSYLPALEEAIKEENARKAREAKEAAEKAAEARRAREEKEAAERRAREAREAFEKLRTAAEQGDAESQFNMGRSYFTGGGETSQDYVQATEWFGKAAAQGHEEAKNSLVKAEVAIKEEKARRALEAKKAAEKKVKEKVKKAASSLLFFAGVICILITVYHSSFFFYLEEDAVAIILGIVGAIVIWFLLGPVQGIIGGLIVFFVAGACNEKLWILIAVVILGLSIFLFSLRKFAITMAVGIIGILLFVFLPKKANIVASVGNTPNPAPAQSLETPQTLPNQTNESTSKSYYATSNLRLRSEPDASKDNQVARILEGDSVELLEVGEIVSVDSITAPWYKVKTADGTTGWVFSGYLSDAKNPLISTWDLKGKEGTVEWIAALVIEKVTSTASGSTFEGYFDWYYSGSLLGREVFSGIYTSSSRKLNLQGTKIENGRKIGGVSLGLGTYEAYLSEDGNNLTRGTWEGGTWEAIKRSR